MRRNLLKAALEDFNPEIKTEESIPMAGTTPAVTPSDGTTEEKTIVLKGNLSEAFTQALDVAFSKKDPVEGETPATESEAQDVQILAEIQPMVTPEADIQPEDNVVEVYGYKDGEVSADDIIEVTKALDESAPTTPEEAAQDNVVIVIDGMITDESGQSMQEKTEEVNLTPALESIARSYGVPVFKSLADAGRYLKSK